MRGGTNEGGDGAGRLATAALSAPPAKRDPVVPGSTGNLRVIFDYSRD